MRIVKNFCYPLFMLLQTTAQKIVFSLLALFLLVTTGKDWFDFYSCGAVSHDNHADGACLYEGAECFL